MKLLFLNVIVGALIGLFTNWLAIVMLFRPWTEKKLFGMKLPMTPGLIPRRQDEIAAKLGEIVEEDLLTPQGLAKSLKRPELEFAVQRAAVKSLGETLQKAPTVGELVTHLFGESALARSEQFLVGRALSFLRSEPGRVKLEGLADALFEHLRGSLSSEEVRRELARGFAGPLHANLSNGELTWQEALPESARLLIEERLQAQLDPLMAGASEWLEAPAVVQAISKMLTEKVESIPLIGAMAKGFLTPDRVAVDIVPRLQAVVQSNTTHELVQEKLQETIAQFWTRPVGQYLGRMSADDLGGLLEKLLHVLMERMFAENGQSRETFRSLLVNGLLAGANEGTIGDLVSRLLDSAASFDLRTLYISSTDTVDTWITHIWHFLRDKLIDEMPVITEALAIRKVVHEQVASYPIPTLEKLVLSVANKELKLITYLGGVLGAIIGLVQGLISMF